MTRDLSDALPDAGSPRRPSDRQWCWRLLDASGRTLAEHSVAVDAAGEEWEAFQDLPSLLLNRPETSFDYQATWLARIGDWAAVQLLGGIADLLAGAAAPGSGVAVRLAAGPMGRRRRHPAFALPSAPGAGAGSAGAPWRTAGWSS